MDLAGSLLTILDEEASHRDGFPITDALDEIYANAYFAGVCYAIRRIASDAYLDGQIEDSVYDRIASGGAQPSGVGGEPCSVIATGEDHRVFAVSSGWSG